MGVKGLWELLSPVGRRVSVETLAGKKLAIDASIWMVQFMKAMRDEKGEMVHNAHLLGFFRRICKLLFLRTKPVFVFDGGTPVLKRRTVIARRRQRENAQAKVRKTAEKLLLNHLKALKLKKLSDDVKNQRMKQKSKSKGQKKSDQVDLISRDLGTNKAKEKDEICGAEMDKNISKTTVSSSCNQEDIDAMLAASIVAEEDGLLAAKAPSGSVSLAEDEGDADPGIILPTLGAEVDLSVLAALPQSMQLDILSQLKGKKVEGLPKDSNNQKQFEVNEKDRGKDKGILSHEINTVGCSSSSDNVVAKKYNQDKVDEMLAASILAEENEKLVNSASTSGRDFISAEEDFISDEDEEMILPAMHGKVDPAVLASLPPSMQLDLLGQMRERLIAENRQKYQKVKKDPAKFSELQIQAYLKTVAFRREINEVQKVASGGVVGGVQTSRIASEANREYIFSRSFTGDKQELTSTSLEKNKGTHHKTSGNHFSQGFVNNYDPANDSSTSSGLVSNEAGSPSDENIQTYLDERGRFRVSRLRAMGMRMTRDIQRNLDLMKEIEMERTVANKAENNNAILSGEKNVLLKSSSNLLVGTSDGSNVDLIGDNSRNEHPASAGDASLEISFMDDGVSKGLNDDDDDLFASLVAGNPGVLSCADNNSLKELDSDSSTDCDWEEGIVEGKSVVNVGIKPSVSKNNYNDESDVEWEDGVCDDANTTLCAAEAQKKTSRGCLEEEADLQEAIRRSLEVTGEHKLNCTSSRHEHSDADNDKSDYALNQDDNLVDSGVKSICGNFGVPKRGIRMGESTLQREGNTEHRESNYKIIDDKMDGTVRSKEQVSQSPEGQSEPSVAFDSEKTPSFIKKPHSIEMVSHSEDLFHIADESRRSEIHLAAEQLLGTLNEDGKVFTNGHKSPVADSLGVSKEDKKNCNYEAEPSGNYSEIPEPVAPFVDSPLEGLTEGLDTQPELPREEIYGSFEKRSNLGKNAMESSGFLSAEDLETQSELPTEDNHGSFEESENNLVKDEMKAPGHLFTDSVEHGLEEEIRILGQEYANLEYEQRKLERNAESVNSELFTECQELLQMFGLPYIIAPMEAEAQCAYLELENLVDGVVTDDSDVFLFGARSVYKNIFDDRKYVETYFMEDIEKELGLSREKLIRMALLLGSDYTEGVSGIGIVNAIEVVNAFPEEDGLQKFRQWVESPDPTIFGRFETKSGSSTQKKASKVEENVPGANCNIDETMMDQNITHAQEHGLSDDSLEIKQIFMNKHRNVSKNWHIPSSFPSETVISAYSCPQVDRSTDPFAWGKPDHLVLRKLCWEKFGWTSQKSDELLLPVLREYNKNETQLRLEAFYTFNERFAKIRSKRIKKAVKGITGNHSSDFTDEPAEDLSKSRKNEAGIPAELRISNSEIFKETGESPADMKPLNLKQSRKRKNSGDTVAKTLTRKKGKLNAPASASGLLEVDVQKGERQTQPSDGSGLVQNRSSKGRGKGARVQRGRRKRSLGIDSLKTTFSGSDSDDQEPEVHGKKSRGTDEVRRSLRSRKIVNYAMDKIEIEDTVASSNQSNKTDLNEEQIDEIFTGLPGVCGNDGSSFSRHKEITTNLSPTKDLPRSYLESGEGFCTDEEKTSHAEASNCDSSRDPGYLKVGGGFCLDDDDKGSKHNEICDNDYLRMGGGFCLDEDETGSKHNEIIDDAATIVDDSAELTRGSTGFVDEAEGDKNITYQSSSVNKISGIELQDRGNTKHKIEMNYDSLNTKSNYDQSETDTGVWISENAHGNTENAATAFSAMPFLRKKRRKS